MLLSKTTILVLLVVMLEESLGFVPKKIIDDLIESVDAASDEMDFGRVSKSVSHDVILKRGLIRSLITYFHEKSEGPAKIRIDDPERYLNDVEKLFTDYYGYVVGKMRVMGINTLLKTDFEPLVASVDLNPDTKDLPSAHFDAESFVESNQRVIDYTSKILTAIDNMDYVLARRFTAQILHTIHDFYSHSNWVEMGNNEINRVIGTDEFAIENRLVATTDSDACLSNCELVEIACSKPTQVLLDMMNQIKPDSAIACPLRYYKCSNNIGLLDRLISGFYTDQKLKDGSNVVNPGGLNKCNHGGLLDSNSYSIDALGGINKDSGIYLISPHADLHLKAAHLAELHTEAFFNLIKEKVGRDRFVEFLKL